VFLALYASGGLGASLPMSFNSIHRPASVRRRSTSDGHSEQRAALSTPFEASREGEERAVMTSSLLVLAVDRDVAGHITVAINRHRADLRKRRMPEPPGLADFEAVALEIVNKPQEASATVNVRGGPDDDLHDRIFLTRADVQRLTGVSLATVDRWLRSGDLPSVKQGRVRRIARTDLNQFLAA
jgi:excisionase family DNA binding protein